MLDKERICAIVVTYKRRDVLKECLIGLLNQSTPVDKIFVVDNDSKDGTEEMMHKEFSLSPVEYINNKGENIGPSACWEIAMRKAIHEDFDWMWLMDDDAEPGENTLNILMRHRKENVFALCPLIINKKSNNPQYYHHKTLDKFLREKYIMKKDIFSNSEIEINANAFVGPLIKTEVVKIVGFPEKEFYIFTDDVEYIYRISNLGKVLLIPKAVIYHKDKLLINNKKYLITWKDLYGFRNYIFFAKKYKNTKAIFFVLKKGMRTLRKALLARKSFYENVKIIKYFYYSLYEGLSGKLNKKYFPIEKICIE